MFATRRSYALAIFALISCVGTRVSAQVTCTLGTVNQSVTICTPSNGATVGTTFHVNAGTTDKSAVQYMQIYLAGKLVLTQRYNYMDASITVPAGNSQRLTVQAKDAAGVIFKQLITINVSSAYSIAPLNPTIGQGGKQQFTASAPSTWSASCGSISASGLFTAPQAQTSCTVTGTASDGSGRTASTTVNVSTAYTTSPQNPTVAEGATQNFTASLPSLWSATCGSIDTNGVFTAPLAQSSCSVTGTANDGSNRTASANVTISSPLTVTPASPTTPVNMTQQFNANMAASWTSSCGTIDGNGLFTATATAGTCTITATATGATAYTATATDTVTNSYSVSPQNPTVSESASQQFTANLASTWSSTCGNIDNSGMFTAPLAQPQCQVTGTATDGSGLTASTSVNISSPITVTPATSNTQAGQTQTFSANGAVTWTASCGTIDTNGVFTSPSAPGSCTITATASSGTPYVGTATDTVKASQPAALNYTTWKNDNARAGLQANETTLTPSNVNASSFGQLFSTAVDARVYAQPLYMSGVTIHSAQHNVVYAATENDTVYAIDGDTGAQLWNVSLLGSGETPANGNTIHSTIKPIVGITGTPVIDASTGTLYVVAYSVTASGTYYHRLHALDITDGTERYGAPVVINGGGFDASQHLQRPGLLLANGTIYIAFSGNGDYDPYHGWIFGYDAQMLTQTAMWNVTPGGSEGGIWMAGSGIASDASGDLYVTTGNGDWAGATEYGQSAVRLSPNLGVVDYFTPIAHVPESESDKDLGSGGILLLPDNTSSHPHEAVNCSKLNVIYVLDRDNMGQLGTSSDNVVQQVTNQLGGTSGTQSGDRCFDTPAFWNNNLYFIGNNDSLKQFSFDPTTGLMSSTPVFQDTFAYLFPGGQPVVSANGNSNAIVWAIDYTTGTLRAYDATNVSNVLYVSPKLGAGVKFTVPTVVNGHVYLGTQTRVVGMGLTQGTSGGCAPPSTAGVNVCSPQAGGSYSSPVTVSAGGTPANGTLNRMELWIDGTKYNNYYTNQINTTVPLTVGSHTVTVVEDDSTGAYIKKAVSITVH